MPDFDPQASWALIFLLIALAFHLEPWPIPDLPDTVSMNLISLAEEKPHAVISFITTADAARIHAPFHWDLLNDIPLGNKRLFTVRLDPAYYTQLVTADHILLQGYHGHGNWSNHTFTRKQLSHWNITGMSRRNSHIDSFVRIDGSIEAPYALFWTTIPETQVSLPFTRRSAWQERINKTGGYWIYTLTQPLNGSQTVSTNLPGFVMGDLPSHAITTILEKKVKHFNFIAVQKDTFTIITVETSLPKLADDLHKDAASA